MKDGRFTHAELEALVESGSVVEIPWRAVRPMKDQPRNYFNKAKMESLKRSIAAKGQIRPGEVRPLWGGVDQQFELVDGERRLRACSLLDRPFKAWVVRVDGDAEEQFERSFISNIARENHTPLEIADAVLRIRNSARIRKLPKGEQFQAVAETAGKSVAWVHSYLGLARLDARLRRLLHPATKRERRLKLGTAFRLSALPREEQLPAYERIQKKRLTTRQAHRHIDKTVLKKGLHKHRRGRNPSDDLALLQRILGRMQGDVMDILTLSDRSLEQMFATRNSVQRKAVTDALDMAGQAIDRVRQRLRLAMRAVPPAPMIN